MQFSISISVTIPLFENRASGITQLLKHSLQQLQWLENDSLHLLLAGERR